MTGDWRDDPGQWQHVRALSLDDAQALVLHNWLYTLKELDALGPEHQAVVSVLWGIEGQLDTQLVAPFKPDYLELLAEAKAEVLRKWNGDEMPIPEDGLGAMEQP